MSDEPSKTELLKRLIVKVTKSDDPAKAVTSLREAANNHASPKVRAMSAGLLASIFGYGLFGDCDFTAARMWQERAKELSGPKYVEDSDLDAIIYSAESMNVDQEQHLSPDQVIWLEVWNRLRATTNLPPVETSLSLYKGQVRQGSANAAMAALGLGVYYLKYAPRSPRNSKEAKKWLMIAVNDDPTKMAAVLLGENFLFTAHEKLNPEKAEIWFRKAMDGKDWIGLTARYNLDILSDYREFASTDEQGNRWRWDHIKNNKMSFWDRENVKGKWYRDFVYHMQDRARLRRERPTTDTMTTQQPHGHSGYDEGTI